MKTGDKYKYFVVILLAIFCGISVFLFIAKFDTIEASKNYAPIEQTLKDDHFDIKQLNPSQMVAATTLPLKYATTTQFVLISFDGSKSIKAWEDILNFSKEMKDSGTQVHFTFFINAVYFLSYATKENYISPEGKVAGSVIGYSDSGSEISDRITKVNRAIRDGHEIGSHTAGHNDGPKWTIDEWTKEFDSFNYILSNIEKLNPKVAFKEPLELNINSIVGFRAPNLGINDNLYSVLYNRKFIYDGSQVAKPFTWPFKDAQGLWHIPLGTVKNKYGRSILAMDYNWWFYQTEAKDLLVKGTKNWDEAKTEVFKAYKESFDARYNGNRAPIIIGHHFSMWNDGVYWEALKEFAKYACTQKNVRCVSHKEFVDAMEGR